MKKAFPILVAGLVLVLAGCGRNADDWRPTWMDGCPRWSPDGSMIAFGRWNPYEDTDDGVYLYDVGRDDLRRLDPEYRDVLAWSQDGRDLIVTAEGGVARLSVGGGSSRRLVDLKARELAPLRDAEVTALLPSRDLKLLLIVIQRSSTTDDPSDYRKEVWLVQVDPPRARMLSLPTQNYVGGASWSQDERWIAYHDFKHIYLIRTDGSRRHVVPTKKGPAKPLFSPDGKKLVYFSGKEEGLFLVDLSSGTNRRLVKGDHNPIAWSRSGGRLLTRIYRTVAVLSATTGREIARLPAFGDDWSTVACPAFSPDGSEIAFVRSWYYTLSPGSGAVYVAPASLTEIRSVRGVSR